MICLYNIVFYLALPFILCRLLWKSRKNAAYKQRWLERLARFTSPAIDKSIWVHAVSLGEAIAATPLIKALKSKYPNIRIVVTTMTPTGSAHITKAFGDEVTHIYAPYDYSGAVKRFLRHYNPQLLLIMETELWPNMLHHCAKQNIPIIIANARISANSEKGYSKIRCFMRRLFNNVSVIATQSQLDADRFINIGAKPQQVQVIGNIKFDINIPEHIFADAKELRQKWGNNRPVWIAASTHDNEEEQILTAFKQVKQTLPNALLILVPRHPERFSYATKLCKDQGFKTISHKNGDTCTPNTDIIIGDTIGELVKLYAASDVAFVGGSLVPKGGHNLLEPAAVNVPIITGPYLDNFLEISTLLADADAIIKINNAADLAKHVIELLQNKSLRLTLALGGAKVIKQNQGAMQKILQLVAQKIGAK